MIRNALAWAAVALSLSACAHPVDVKHQGDASFHREYQTYTVLYHPVGSSANTRTIFENAVHQAMTAKGYAQAPRETADMFINFKALTTSEDNAPAGGRNPGGVDDGPSVGSGDATKVVMVTIEDARSDEIMWVGWSTGAYETDDVLTKTREAVDGILSLVPARAAGAAPAAAPPAPTPPAGS